MDSSFYFRETNIPFYGEKPKEGDDMSKDYVVKNIEMIDEQLKLNEEFINEHPYADVLFIQKMSNMLIDARKAWVDMLLRDYGIYYL